MSKEQSTGCELVDVRGLCLRMPTKASNPVIEVINGNKEHVWLVRSFIPMDGYYGREQCKGNAGRSGDVYSARHFAVGTENYLNLRTIYLNPVLMASRRSFFQLVSTAFWLLRAQLGYRFLYDRKIELKAFFF